MRPGTRLAALLVVLCAVSLATPPAFAHAALVSSTPGSGARLAALPDSAVLTFSADISAPAYVVVTGPDGSRTDVGEPSVAGREVRATLGSGGPGTYALAFRVVSVDGHPVTGQLSFVVGDGPLTPRAPAPSASGPERAAGTTAGGDAGATAGARSAEPSGAARVGAEWWQVGVGVGLLAAAALLLGLSRRAPR
ncbi:copper resistance CopC family protein [Nocardioides daeguensis]|uniref:Copper resistance protein CopC n=1 Tax=Nocardioides daeguensis TaxID=908359 RepID=A0ABP6VKY2_9ACTN|nr:copper resistance CopC family protein [Nocardioides daeguensis]MBV6728977.1 copper resistance protein CopC [Nocardioides daeguensis]MCR1773498.1 copper resistance protein CopC [Nocardioides daeguensis]